MVVGRSEHVALEALAARRGRELAAEGIAVVAMGGARNIRRFLELFGPRGLDVRLAGLCDAREEADFRRGLERAGLGSNLGRADMEALGFYVCVADLEDELIRCLDAARVEQVVEGQDELGSFRTFQQQPAWQGRSSQEQLRRFIGTHSGRKIRYARLLVDALELTSVPRDRKSTRLNSSHANISYAVFCLKKKHKLPTLTVTPDKYLTLRYAGPSGDYKPIHINQEFAKQVGLQARILHGLWTMSQVASAQP